MKWNIVFDMQINVAGESTHKALIWELSEASFFFFYLFFFIRREEIAVCDVVIPESQPSY